MKNLISDIKKRPFHLFIPTAIVLLIIASLAGRQPFDINFHDTYVVMPLSIAFSLVIVLLLILWGLYKLTEKIFWQKWLV
ncbi:MAG: hypothetical protein V4619_13260 [Bacteroidota bacterium]